MLRPEGHPIVAALIDPVMAPLQKVRRKLIPRAAGDVLELGAGTGANFALYQPDVDVIAVEPDPHMLQRAERRAAQAAAKITLVEASGEALPFDDEAFDTAILSFVLCTIPDPDAALREVHRVLRPTGTLLFAEHVCSHHPRTQRVQDLLTPAWRRLAGGCHLNRDAVGMLNAAGFEVTLDSPMRSALDPFPVVYGHARKA